MFVVSLPKHDQSITSLKEQDVEFEPMLTSAYNFLARRDPYAEFLGFIQRSSKVPETYSNLDVP